MDDPALRGLLRRLRTKRAGHARQLGTRVSCARAPWVRLAGTHRRLDESSMPLEPCARGHGDHAGTARAHCSRRKGERAEPLLTSSPSATRTRTPIHPRPVLPPSCTTSALARSALARSGCSSHHVAHPAPDEDPAARLAAASITLRVHARRRRCGSSRARQGDAAHSQAAAATGCPRRRDEAVRGRDVRRLGGHVAPVCRAAGRALVRSSAQREHASSSDGSPRAHA